MIIAENKSGQQLLEYIPIPEKDFAGNVLGNNKFSPLSGAFAFIRCKGKYLICYNKWRNQWEFPAGKIEEGETPKECAIRELYEETNQKVTNLEYRGIFQIFDKNNNQIRYRAVYFAEVEVIADFSENNEMNKIMLWDLESDIGYFDEVDKRMLELSMEQEEIWI